MGRKTANLILGDVFGQPAYVCDTHCIRITGRLGITDGSKDPLQVERQLINTERYREMADIRTGSNSFQVLLCIGGCGVLFEENGESLNFFKGDCLFLPADSVPLKIHGRAQMLKVSC